MPCKSCCRGARVGAPERRGQGGLSKRSGSFAASLAAAIVPCWRESLAPEPATWGCCWRVLWLLCCCLFEFIAWPLRSAQLCARKPQRSEHSASASWSCAGGSRGSVGSPVGPRCHSDPICGVAGLAVGREEHRCRVPLLVQLVVPGGSRLEGCALQGVWQGPGWQLARRMTAAGVGTTAVHAVRWQAQIRLPCSSIAAQAQETSAA